MASAESSQPPERGRSQVRPPTGSSIIRARLAAMQVPDDDGVTLAGHEDGVEEVETPTRPGEQRYVMRGEIARGGMGAILRVWDADLRRNIAMKLVLDRHFRDRPEGKSVDPHVLSRFLDEAQVTGQLDHPGVVPVHELGIEPDGRIYFTMRLVRGRDFEEVIDLARVGEENWTRTRALATLLRVCETMAYAHSKGVVHRDLKPANVMVGQFGETYVMDWGLAKIVGRNDRADVEQEVRDSASTLGLSSILTDRSERARGGTPSPLDTQQGHVVGTPYYMPPEQAAGRISEIGPHSDVYSAGCMLYQLLTGLRPYEKPGDRVDVHTVLAMVMHSPPARILDLDATAPAELVAICERAMATDWRERYPSMLEMAIDVRAYLEGRVVSAHETGTFAGLKKWVLRHRALSAALVGMVLLALGSATALAWQQRQRVLAITEQQALTAAAQLEAEANLTIANANAEILRNQSYATNVMAADVSLRAGEVREAKRHLEECPPGLRGWEWRHLSRRADAALAVLTGHTATISSLAVDVSGRLAVSGAEDGTAIVWDLVTGAAAYEPLAAHDSGVVAVAFTAGGERIVTLGGPLDPNMRLWNTSTGVMVSDQLLTDYGTHSIALSPDGAAMAFGTADGSIRILSTSTTLERSSIPAHERRVAALVFSPDGTHMFSGSTDRTVALWRVADGARVWSTAELSAPVQAVAIHANGSRLAAGLEGGLISEHDAASGAHIRTLSGHMGDIEALDYAADGRLVSGSFDKTVRVWGPEGDEPLAVLLGHDQPVQAVAFTAGGLVLSGSADTTVRAVDPAQFAAVAQWIGPDEFVSAVAVAPDGARVLAGTAFMGSLALLDISTAEVEHSIPGADDLVRAVAFHPDGRSFAWTTEQDAVIHRMQLGSYATMPNLEGHALSITSLAFSPDGERLASGSKEQAVRLWELASGHELARFEGHSGPVQAVAFAPDSRRVASADTAGGAYVWDAESTELVATLSQPVQGESAQDDASLNAIAYAPDGMSVATGGADPVVRVWNAGTGELQHEFRGHDQTVSALAYSGDGRRLISGSYDGTVRVWNTTSGRLLLVLRVDAEITGVAYAPDGMHIVASAADNTVRIWSAPPPR